MEKYSKFSRLRRLGGAIACVLFFRTSIKSYSNLAPPFILRWFYTPQNPSAGWLGDYCIYDHVLPPPPENFQRGYVGDLMLWLPYWGDKVSSLGSWPDTQRDYSLKQLRWAPQAELLSSVSLVKMLLIKKHLSRQKKVRYLPSQEKKRFSAKHRSINEGEVFGVQSIDDVILIRMFK